MSIVPEPRKPLWHAGEKKLQEQVGVSERMDAFGPKVIRDHMPDQHRDFYHQLPFMIMGTVDPQDRPWATLVEGPEGFVSSPDPRRLLIASPLDDQDPAAPGVSPGNGVGLLGIELHTRRRNRLNGMLQEVSADRFEVAVEQSFGNCPQYIQRRSYTRVESHDEKPPRIDLATLDARAREMIDKADTFFVASYVEHDDGQRSVDVSHRGGRPGFVKVRGNRLTIPDYAGNLHFNTLGNLTVNPVAGLLFVDFSTGDVLQLTGRATVVLDSPMIAAFEGAERLWTLDIEQVVVRPAAVSIRWSFDEYAPTSLATGTWAEADLRLKQGEQHRQWHAFRVVRVEQESPDIRSFYLQPPDDVSVAFKAGQHLAVRVPVQPGAAPLARTYSLSSAPTDEYPRISVKAQGPASRYLHEHLGVGDSLEARLPMGGFTLDSESERPAVLIGAGVGITPLVSMLGALVEQNARQGSNRRIHLFQGGRALGDTPFREEIGALAVRASGALQVHRALSNAEDSLLLGRDYQFSGRLGIEQVKAALSLDDYDFYLCGPASFTQDMYEGLRDLNIADARIHAEAFGPSTLKRRVDKHKPPLEQPPAATEPVPVQFSGSAKEARWTPQSGSLLELAESRGLSPDFSCRNGACGTCQTRLVSGQVHYPNPPEQLPESGTVLICCAVPAVPEDSARPLVLDL